MTTRTERLNSIMESYSRKNGEFNEEQQAVEVTTSIIARGATITKKVFVAGFAFDDERAMKYIEEQMKKRLRQVAAFHIDDIFEKTVTNEQAAELFRSSELHTVDRYSPEELAKIEDGEIGMLRGFRIFVAR